MSHRETWADEVAAAVLGRHGQVGAAYQEIAALLGVPDRMRSRSGFASGASGAREIMTSVGPVVLSLSAGRGGAHRVKAICPFCGKAVGLGTRAVQHARVCPRCGHEDCAEHPQLALACRTARRRR